jgi:hypothetical protein
MFIRVLLHIGSAGRKRNLNAIGASRLAPVHRARAQLGTGTTIKEEFAVRAIIIPALAAGALLLATPASALPPVGGAAQGYSDYLNETLIEVKRGGRRGHRHHARRHHHVRHHHVRHHHFKRHRHFAFRIHRRHHYRYDPCPYGYVLVYGRCVPYYVR